MHRPIGALFAPWLIFITFCPLAKAFVFGQGQVADTSFQVQIESPRFPTATGPVVAIDEAHCNFHQLEGRYRPFADVLQADGYQLQASQSKFAADSLQGIDLLVIANALAPENEKNWSLPTPSAFEAEEIRAVVDWVEQGGSLLLIADHMPFPGAAEKLAKEFGVIEWRNGFASQGKGLGAIRFEAAASSAAEVEPADRALSNSVYPLPRSANTAPSEAIAPVPWVVTFTGSCFRASEEFQARLVLGEDSVSLEPTTAWKFHDETERKAVGGYWQGAVRSYGQGRIAIFGEAAMFTAQASGGAPFGLSDPRAKHNQEFLLRTIHWLTTER